ncbi:MAG: hypothetical protein QM541_15370 [Flavobacterium sp.]|nr:hypothetical protein [Flavobacterium sp.]
MQINIKIAFIVIIMAISSCEYVTYTHKSKRNKAKERPPITLFDKLIDFRIEQNSWPVSREDFISKGIKYQKALVDFKYLTITFQIKDSNTMVFRYFDHIKDVEAQKQSEKIELNTYQGTILFFKENNQFVWKKLKY